MLTCHLLDEGSDRLVNEVAFEFIPAGDQATGALLLQLERVFEKFYLGASRLSMRRMAARSMKASDVWTMGGGAEASPLRS